MKNKLFPMLILLFLVAGCGFGIKAILESEKTTEKAIPIEEDNVTELRCQVFAGMMERQVRFDGRVVNHNRDEYVTFATDNTKKAISEMKCAVGDEVVSGQVLYTIGGKEYKSSVDGVVVDIMQESTGLAVSILDYNRLYIDVSVDYEYLDRIPVGTELKIIKKNELSEDIVFCEVVSGHAFFVDESTIDVYLTNTKHFLPGMAFEVLYEYTDETDSCYTLKEMLLEDASGFYVFKETDMGRERQSVVLGREFVRKEDGVETHFVEIISGVKEGDKLIVDIIEE